MVKIKKFLSVNRKYKATYIREIPMFNISSDDICDEAIPHKESTVCMMWLYDDDTLCELESIDPIEIGEEMKVDCPDVPIVNGCPVFDITKENKIVKLFREGRKNNFIFLAKIKYQIKMRYG